MMFSTSAGDAFPVRTPANSCCTTSSVLIIFSSASNKMSSRVIVDEDYHNSWLEGKGAFSYLPSSSLGISPHDSLSYPAMDKQTANRSATATVPRSEGRHENSGRADEQANQEMRKWFESLEHVLEFVLKKQGSAQA